MGAALPHDYELVATARITVASKVCEQTRKSITTLHKVNVLPASRLGYQRLNNRVASVSRRDALRLSSRVGTIHAHWLGTDGNPHIQQRRMLRRALVEPIPRGRTTLASRVFLELPRFR